MDWTARDNTLLFVVRSSRWKDKTHTMYRLKDIFNKQGWKNGQDYLFVRPSFKTNTILVRFAHPEFMSIAALMYDEE
jgi:hypothetical protein